MKKLLLLSLLLTISLCSLFSAGAKETSVTEITFWHSNSGILGEAIEDLVDNFNDSVGKEKNIFVTAIYQGKASDVLTKVKAVSQSGDKSEYPSLVQLDATGVVDMAANSDLLYVEDLFKANGDDLSFLLDHAKESMMYKNRVIGLPFNASTILYYYNKTLFDKAGVKEIKTLDDLINVADKLCQKDENGKIVTYAISSVPTTYEMCAFIGSQKGGSYLTDMDNGHLGFATKTVFKEEGTLKAFLEKWAELYKTGELKNSTSGVTTEFVSGQTASMFASTSNLTTVINAIDGRFELGVSYLPMVNEEATGGVNLGGGALFTFDQDENTSKAVYEFMKYLTSAESQLTWHIKTGYLPVNKDTYNLDEFKTHCKQNPEFKVASDQLLASNPKVVGLWIPNGYEVYYAFQSNIKAMLEENISIEETVDKMTNEIDRGLDAFNRQNLN